MASRDANARIREPAAPPPVVQLQPSAASVTSPAAAAPSSAAAPFSAPSLAGMKPVYRARTVADATPLPRATADAARRTALHDTLKNEVPVYRVRAARVTAPAASSTDLERVLADVAARAIMHAVMMASAPVYRKRDRHADPSAIDTLPDAAVDAEAADAAPMRRRVIPVLGLDITSSPLPLAAAPTSAVATPVATAAAATGVASSLTAPPASPTTAVAACDENRTSGLSHVAPVRRYECVLLPSVPSRRRRAV